ncbi:MAG TPA: NADH-quinone oxidoreductase subunit NuoK [Candidatus Latescibacteria bacterium]|jgi:NADH:ubiquinone oxidoreductase subunit K|nr:NADH-quinone oxidoreductase subunit NuoK [Gemmatimonadota bacterium]MDP7631329.1 NADH-quinone oxidoreductase subunit NuoK [Candidatus Latescibacterota bacterium]MBU09723.1 NADH-quinone oxidoreductase subunit NuoK [Gemmatimonadota bacterium]MED5413542.1 NADH-quinone oxidoreductase subunit NuoK [Candidatus Latescibacterota bacterium]MEE3042968.1 NADH-quinone oxidoreductase subunit NuoK [Candidatus Latescibacterota bacterium]|tara:strand:+ start:282 stop:587 length:306 start_codon:yes stop_codon:yes gene_type:complete
MTLEMYLLLSAVLFSLGLFAALSQRNLIAVLIGVELMMNAASLNFMAFNRFSVTDPATGQVFVLIIIGLAAAEVAIFLSIILNLYRQRHTIDAESITELRR